MRLLSEDVRSAKKLKIFSWSPFQLSLFIFDVATEPKEPTINGKKDDEEEVYHTLGTFFQLSCYFVGLPNPRIQWYKDGALIRNSTRYSVNEQTLQISDATKKDDGNFECFGVNRVGWAKKVFKLKIIRSPIYIYVSVAVATVIMLGLIIHFVARSRQVNQNF